MHTETARYDRKLITQDVHELYEQYGFSKNENIFMCIISYSIIRVSYANL